MTEDRAANNSNMPVASDAFVGFVYATTISLVIKTAYVKSNLDSIVPAHLRYYYFSHTIDGQILGQLKMSG